MTTLRSALIVLFALTLAACGGDGDSGGDPTASSWGLASGTLDGEAIPLVDGHPITLDFDETGVGGQAACNNYFGGYTISDNEISFSDLGQTMMACAPDEVMESETKYLQALALVETFNMGGDSLTLSGDGVELVFDETT